MGQYQLERCQEQGRVITVEKKDTSLASAQNHGTRVAGRAAAAVLTTAHAITVVNSAISHVTAPHKRSQPVSALPSSVVTANTETHASSRTSLSSKLVTFC